MGLSPATMAGLLINIQPTAATAALTWRTPISRPVAPVAIAGIVAVVVISRRIAVLVVVRSTVCVLSSSRGLLVCCCTSAWLCGCLLWLCLFSHRFTSVNLISLITG